MPKMTRKIRQVLDLDLAVSVVLATKEMPLGEVLHLAEGQVITFKKHHSEPLDLRVNRLTIGRGKAVKYGERFGLHLREIGPASEIVQQLGPSAPR